MSPPLRVAVVGLGKIARDQHLPAIHRTAGVDLVATVSPDGASVAGAPAFADLDALAASGVHVDAVALCTPPTVRPALALRAVAHGWHCMLEKPPGATLAELEDLHLAAEGRGAVLFAAWHCRFANGVEPARRWLDGRVARRGAIRWREDARVWHPGQRWIWEAGGFGVFDPGINALSILTRVLPETCHVESAELRRPLDGASPFAARITLRTSSGAPVDVDLDFLHEGEPCWEIDVETDDGALSLLRAGADLLLPDGPADLDPPTPHGEYAAVYARFRELVLAGTSEVDLSPLLLTADALMQGVNTFEDTPALW